MEPMMALADPTRRKIVELLAVRDYTAGELVRQFDFSAPAISQHLKVLREARLIKARIDGQRRIQSLDLAGLNEIESWVATTKRFWEQRLDALERALLAETKKTTTNKTETKKRELNENKQQRLR